MSTVAQSRFGSDYRQLLTTAITVLERLGIIDFNGHCSARLPDGNILINSGGSVRSAISPDDFVVVGANGEVGNAVLLPPRELPLHVAVYKARPDVHAVVHGHPKWSTLLSSAGLDYQVTMAQGALLGEVPTYPSPKSVNNATVANEVASVLGSGRAALLRAHGSVITGEDIVQAAVLAIYLELNAERYVNATLLGDPYVFSADEIAACQKGLSSRGLFEKCWNYYLASFGLSSQD